MGRTYGSITIVDTTDIERIYMVYKGSESNTTAPTLDWSTISTWKENITQVSGTYIWQVTVIKQSGVPITSSNWQDFYGDPTCITGPRGIQGIQGETGIGVSSITTTYCNYGSGTPAASYIGWQSTVPTYDSTKPNYWVKTVLNYDNGTSDDPIIYKDNGITSATSTAAAANITANNANTTANNANTTANNANTTANNAYNIATGINQHFWTIATDYATGLPAGSYITDTASDTFKSQKTGGNILTRSDGIWIRNGIKTLASLTGTSLIFYNPSSNAKGMELDSSALKFYDATGTVAQATFGGTQATISGTINVYDGKIGNNANNYWYIGNYTDYNQNYSAIIKSKGTASIQLNETNTWRISTNRIHTAWAPETGTDAFKLHFPKFNDSKTVNKYWDFGLHLPISYSDKFLYIRNASGSETLDNLLNDLDDGGYDYWKYRFYISADGSLYAKNLYVLDDDGNTTQIGGTDGVYLLKSGGTITGNLEVNGTLTKGGKTVTYLTTTPTSGQILIADGISGSIKTSGYTIATSVPSGAIFTDYRVKTEARGSTTMYLAGSNSSGTVSQGTLLTDSGVYIQTSSSSTNLVVPKINGYTLAAASAKGVDTSLTTSSTSTNLPTSKAVVDLIKQYLPLTGGSITGPVNFGDSVSIDDLTAGNLIVSGAGRFTNGLYGDLIGNADTATKVGNDLKIQLNGGTTEGTNQFTFNGSAAKTVNITKSSIGLGNVENKSSATIRGELTSSNVTTALGFTPYNATNPNGYTTNTGTVTSVKVQGSNGLTGSGTVTTSGTITLSHDDTSSQASSSNSGRTYIQSVTLDGYGHVTGLSTATETVTNTHNTAYLYAGASDGTANAATTNGNTYLILMDGGSATTRRKISGSGTVSVASNASGDITITGSAHPVALNGVSFANGIITFTKTDGNSTTIQTDNFVITQAAGATALVGTDTNHTPLNVNGPVKFTDGVPVSMRPSSASGKFLKDDGTWDTPGGTYSLPLAASGTRGGVQIGYSANGKNYPVQLSSEKMYVNVPWTDTTYTVATGDSNGQIKVTPSSGDAYNVSVKGLGSNAYTSTAYLPLSGGTMSGNLLGNSTATLGSTANPFHQLVLGGATNATMDATSANPRITFQENTGTQPVYLVYTDLDSYRSPAGLKIVGNSTSGNISSPAWLEVEGTVYAGGFSGPLSGNASTATEFSSNATVTLTGDTTGTSAGSKKSWSISTTTSRLSYLGRRTTAATIALNPSVDTGFKMSWHISDSTSRTADATNSPSFDAAVINLPWDWGAYNGQIAITNTSNTTPRIQIRSASHTDNGTSANPRYTPNYSAWREIVTATKATQIGSATQPVYVSNTGQIIAGTTLGGAAYQAADYYVKKAGDTMTGQLKTSFKSSVATGSYQAVATTIEALCEELRYSSGVMGSVNITTAYTKDGITMPTQWYNFLWVPHRSGGVNGTANGDNCNYGSLYLSGMTGSGMYMIRYSSSAIAELKNLYNPPSAVKATQDKNGNDITTKYVTVDTNQTITANQKTFNGAIRFGTSSSSTKYGAAHYDSTLEAIVFSFA